MKKYLLSILLSTLPLASFAACQGAQQPLVIAGENICGTGFQMAFNKFTSSCTSDIDLFWLDFF